MEQKLTAQIAAAYFGQKVKIEIPLMETFIIGIHENGLLQTAHSVGTHDKFNVEYCQLILKPLSAITDEDAIEVAKIAVNHTNNVDFSNYEITLNSRDFERIEVYIGGIRIGIYYDGRIICSNKIAPFIFLPTFNMSQIADFLRSTDESKGKYAYDCGYGSIPSLIDAGIAIDETKM